MVVKHWHWVWILITPRRARWFPGGTIFRFPPFFNLFLTAKRDLQVAMRLDNAIIINHYRKLALSVGWPLLRLNIDPRLECSARATRVPASRPTADQANQPGQHRAPSIVWHSHTCLSLSLYLSAPDKYYMRLRRKRAVKSVSMSSRSGDIDDFLRGTEKLTSAVERKLDYYMCATERL